MLVEGALTLDLKFKERGKVPRSNNNCPSLVNLPPYSSKQFF